MPISTSVIGRVLPPHTADVEPGRLRFFAKAIGETDPVYSDPAAARKAGHRDLPVPPTFLFCLNMEKPDPFALLNELRVDLRRVLHGGQGFTYRAMAYAGDRLTFTTTVKDVYAKRGGALEFIVQTTEVTRVGETVATLDNSIVVRNPEAGR